MRVNNPVITPKMVWEKMKEWNVNNIIYCSDTFVPMSRFLKENGINIFLYNSLEEILKNLPKQKLIELYYKLDK